MTLWAEVWYREHNVPGYMAGPEFWGQERRAKFGNRLVGVARGIGAGLEGVGAVGVFFVQPAAGIALGAHAADSMQASVRMVISGEDTPTFTQSSITYVAAKVGFSESTSETIGVIGDSAMPIVILGVAGLRSSRAGALVILDAGSESGSLRFAGTRGVRNTSPLTAAQEAEIWQGVRDLGLNPSDVRVLRTPSAYSDSFDVIMIGPDAFPAAGGGTTGSVFERLTPRAVVAHEAGHMITTRGGTAFPGGTLLDEFQASLVGRNLPGLSSTERFQLLRDTVERARAAGESPRVLLIQIQLR